MQEFLTWFRAHADLPRPWLILGKGPSFAKRSQFGLSEFSTLGLNHVCREQPVTVAHVIDLDVIDQCGDALERSAQFLVMPWIPHVRPAGFQRLRPRHALSDRNLGEIARDHPVLRRLAADGRLLWYNLSTAPTPHGASPVIGVRYFSVEAALNLLATAGVRTVRSLGIDGGASYSGEFDDLQDRTLLTNGRSSFDRQFEEIARMIMSTGIDYAPLDVPAPIRVYVAATDAQMLSVKVLEYSIRKHTSLSTDVYPIHQGGIDIPQPRDPRNCPRTPFSFQRFLIPELARYSGRAVYLDSDMQVFRDLRELWTLPFDGASVLAAREPGATGRKPQFSVMLLDCDTLKWDIREIVQALDTGALTYEQLMHDMKIADVKDAIDPRWNSLERFKAGETALVHYTDMDTQPWVATSNPIGYLWTRDLFEAIDAGFLSRADVEDHVRRGYVRPSLLFQIDERMEDSALLPKQARALDAGFVAPFKSIRRHGASPWRSPARLLRAMVRQAYHNTLLYRLERRLRNRMSM